MAYALIDNSTLTATQRLLGEIKVRSLESVDCDIAAFENLIEAILFYDDLICINDYKPEFKEGRVNKFPFIKFLEPEAFSLNLIEDIAMQEAKQFHPIIKGGEFADEDFRSFLDLLKMNIICTWDVSQSIYYLTLKMLGEKNSQEFNKYGKLSAAIFNELTDLKYSKGLRDGGIELYDSKGQVIKNDYIIPGAKMGGGKTGGLTGSLAAFVASLNWICYRTLYYCYSAKYFKADVFLYPIRQAFQIKYMAKTNVYDSDFARFLIGKMTNLAKKEIELILNINQPATMNLQLPFFLAWLVNEAGDIKHVMPTALEIRNTPSVSSARQQLKEIQNLCYEDDYKEAIRRSQKILGDLEKQISLIRKDFGLKTEQGIPWANLIQVYNTIAAFANWPTLPEFKGKIPDFMSSWTNKKGFCSLYRDISSDLLIIPRLGKVRDKLGEKVVVDKDALIYSPKVESSEYRYSHSSWKSPM